MGTTMSALRGLWVLLLLVLQIGAAERILAGQRGSQRDPELPEFRSEVELVALEVCVKGRDGRLINDLTPQDFLVLEDRTPQQLSFFLPGDRVPLAVVMLMDRSSSMMGSKLERAKAAASAFIRALNPQDRVGLITFARRADRAVPLGTDHRAAERAVAEIPPAGGLTGMFDAILVALQDLKQARARTSEESRYVMIVLSDGQDTSSLVDFDEVLDAVRRSDVMVYGISLRTDAKDRWLAPGYELARLAADTGGRAVGVRATQDLTSIYEEIAAELRHLYRLGYVSSNTGGDGKWRTVSVRVARPDARARTRRGYFAAGPRPGS